MVLAWWLWILLYDWFRVKYLAYLLWPVEIDTILYESLYCEPTLINLPWLGYVNTAQETNNKTCQKKTTSNQKLKNA